jgi:predicted Zn-dependent peptidase
VDSEKVLKQIKEQMLPTSAVEITRINKEEPETVVESYVEQSLSVAQPMFCFGFKENGEKRSTKQKICTCLLLEILAGDASPLYKELVNEGLINDEFSFEYFTGNGYASVIFDGESNNPKAVAEKIKAEVERIKLEGIDKKLFSAIRCGMYGNAIRLFQSVESIAMQMADCAMNDSGLFDDIKYLRSVTVEDVYKRLLLLDNDKTVLSVINPKEK